MKRSRSSAVPRRKLAPRSTRATFPLRNPARKALVAFAALLAGLIVPVATIASDALPSDAVLVYECRFLEEWDLNYDRWPDRWTRRSGSEFPHYVDIRIQDDPTSADGQCLRIDLDGASAEVSSPSIPISPQFSYLFEAQTKAQNLLHGEARVTIDFCDEADAVIQSVSSEPLVDGPAWSKVRLSVEPNDPRIRRAYIRLSVLRGEKPDLAARVSLGDITLSRFPRITVSTNHPFNVYQEAEPIVIHCELSGILQQQPEIHFQLRDASQRILDEARLSVRGDLIAEAASNGSRQGARDAPSGYEGTCAWRPRISEPGLYCVTVNMLAPSGDPGAAEEVRQLDHRVIWIAIVPPLDIPMEGDFGWTLGEHDGGSNFSELARLLPQAAVNWVKLPLWFDAGDVNRGNELIRFVELLGASNIEVVGIIDRPPRNVRIEGVAPRADGYPAVADLFGLDSGAWSPSLDPVMIRLALRVRWWQLGRDYDTSFMGIADLNQQIAALRARLFRFGQEVKLGLAWDWLNDNQGAGKVTWDFQQFSSETPPDESQFIANLEKPRANDALRWILVEPPPRKKTMSAAEHDLRTTEFVRRLVAAKQSGADGLFIPSPFDDSRGIMNDDGSPGPLFLPWRTTSAMLGGSRYLGKISLPEGSDNRIFLRPDGEVVMVVWSAEPKTETLFLGAEIRQFDFRGVRIAHFDSTAEQSIAVGPMPTFVLGLHEQIARWRMSMRFKSVEVPSIFSVPHANAIQFENFFPQGVGGSFSIFVPPPADEVKYGFSGFVPDHWLIEPPRGTFRLAAGEKADIPFEIRLKNAMYGKQPIRIDFTIEADQPYRFSIYREMEVGTRDLTLEIRSHLDKDGVLIIEQLMSNTADRLADFKCNLYAKGQRRQRMQVFRLGPNIDRKIYRFPAGAKLVGEDMLLEIEELSGPRVIKYRFTATDNPPPADKDKGEEPAGEGVEDTLISSPPPPSMRQVRNFMLTVDEISRELARIAPLALAESWDNVGLLVGDRARPAARVMTCLTLTPPVVEEAVAESADLVVVHHPLPFRPVSQITSDSTVGAMLWRLIGAQVALYSAHTAFDSAREGINARWAAALDLSNVAPLVPPPEAVELPGPLGAGRRGRLSAPLSLDEIAARIKQFLGIARVRVVDAGRARVDEIAIACGSGGSFIPAAVKASCNCLITGEATFHNCLEAEASALALILVGHYASERFAMEELAAELGDRFPEIACWASRTERDPLRTS